MKKVRETEYTKVICIDEPGPGNACHKYLVKPVKGIDPLTKIGFQNGPIKENGVNGCQNEDLLAIVIDRLEGFQSGDFACDNNEAALEFCRSALYLLEARTKERKERGVEGRNLK